jgi:hypothetical protein
MTTKTPRITTTSRAGERSRAVALLSGLTLDNGELWGESALPFQRADAEAVLDPDGPRRHFLLRGRGMSKTTDVAGMALALLLTEAPAGSASYVYAADEDQAGLLADALAGFVLRSPDLRGLVKVSARAVEVRATGARLSVETSDGASAFGTLPWLTIVDELTVWPETTNHRRLWSAIVSSVPKVPGSRLVVIGTAGSPTGLGAKVWTSAVESKHWHTSVTPGPSPWWSPDDIEAAKADMTPAQWRRLILCEFAEGDDALTSPEDVDAAIRPDHAVIPPTRSHDYVAALDVGTRRDLTALAVGHAEHTEAGRTIIIDRVMYWRPTPGDGPAGRVDLAEVEAAVLRVCREYHARLRFDRMQAEQLTTNLTRAGIHTEEFVFSTTGANRLARSVYTALRDRTLSLPDDEEVRDEFMSARLVETGPGTLKLQNPDHHHDDIVTTVAMVVADLTSRPEVGRGGVTVPRGWINRTQKDYTAARPRIGIDPRTQSLAALRNSRTIAVGGGPILVPGSANDPRRVVTPPGFTPTGVPPLSPRKPRPGLDSLERPRGGSQPLSQTARHRR